MFLADVNVLLALAFDAHEHHELARRWFESVDSCAMCRLTQSGFLRLASNPALFGDEALSLSEAWACFDTLMGDERLAFVLEPPGLEHAWRRLTIGDTYSPKVWNDRYLAAFALTGDMTLVTLDKAFRSIRDLKVLVLDK